MKNDLCIAIEASDLTLHLTRTSIYHFIKTNPWFTGKIYLLTHSNFPFSVNNLISLKLIHENIEIFPVDTSSTINAAAQRLRIKMPTKDQLFDLLKMGALAIPNRKMLYFSSTYIFLNDISSAIIDSNLIDDTCSLFYINDRESINLDLMLESKPYASLTLLISTILSANKIKLDFSYSHQIPNHKFNISKSKILASYAIIFTTLKNKSTNFSKINQVWLSKNTESVNFLKNPKNSNIRLLASGISPVLDYRKMDPTATLGISVIVPAYNVSNYIEECLDSITRQKVNIPIEILVGVDNCNTTLTKLLELKPKYPNLTVFSTGVSVGPYIIRNSLVDHAKYPNLLFFDADDIMKDTLIPFILSIYDANRIIRFKYTNFSNGSRPEASRDHNKAVAHGVFFTPKSIFDQVGGFQGWLCAADTEFIKRCEANKIRTINSSEYLFYRRIHSASLTQNKKTNHVSQFRIKKSRWIKENRDWRIPIIAQKTKLIAVHQ